MTVEPRTVTAFIGPSGCGKSTVLRTLNRMHEVIPGARVEGKVTARRRDLYGAGVDPVAVRRHVGMVFQRPNPFPTMSIYDNVAAGLRLNGVRKQGRPGRRRREVAARREPVGRGQGPAEQAGRGPVRRPAAAAVHRPGDRGRAAGAADGRAVLGARPDLHARDRGPDRRAEGRSTRSSSSRTTCSRPPGSRDTTAFFNLAGAGQPGRLVEIDATAKIFTNPSREAHRGLHHRPVRLGLLRWPSSVLLVRG